MTTKSKHIYRLQSPSQLELHNASAEFLTYRGRQAVRLVEQARPASEGHSLAILPETRLKDGTITTYVSGALLPTASEDMRGFVGIAFHVQPNAAQFECFYLRPTNGRAEDQLRRNHVTQYISHPDYPWYRLREDHPGVYESYADMLPGAWTRIRIAIAGVRAFLYVNSARQPSLVVNDLKLGSLGGSIGLWIGAGTEAHFSTIVTEGNAM